MSEPAGTYEEWRVHGEPGGGYPPYEYVWSRRLSPNTREELEAAARAFVAAVRSDPNTPWLDGPHLSSRTVTVSEWRVQP